MRPMTSAVLLEPVNPASSRNSVYEQNVSYSSPLAIYSFAVLFSPTATAMTQSRLMKRAPDGLDRSSLMNLLMTRRF